MQNLISKQIGRYTIQQAIGEGGMGMVYRALDRILDSNVDIKGQVPVKRTDSAERRA